MFNINNSDENSNNIEMKNPEIIESYNSKNNYFYLINNIIKIQTLFRQHSAIKRVTKLKNINNNMKNNLLSENKNSNNINNTTNITSSNKEPSVINKKINNKNNNDIHTIASSFLTHFSQDTNLTDKSPNAMKGLFLLKKKKFKHQGHITIDPNTNEKIKNGFGIITWTDNCKLLSFFRDNKARGASMFTNPKHNTKFVGMYTKNKPLGFGIFTNSFGTKFEGYWTNNVLSGPGEVIWKDGTFYRGDFENNKRNGIGIYRWPDGTIYEGEWNDDKMTGYCEIIYNDKRIYQGNVLNGMMNGYGEFSWEDGKKYIGYYKNDLKSGFGAFIWSIKPFQGYVGFWRCGKVNWIGMKIKGGNVKYGLWDDGNKKSWFEGKWELVNYLKGQYDGVEGNNNKKKIENNNMLNEEDKIKDKYILFMMKDVNVIKKFFIQIYEKKI
jgi:hypothetical protein